MDGVIFDMDGVLVETEGYHYRAWQEAFNTVGVSIDYDQYERCCQAQGRPNAIRNVMGTGVGDDVIERLSRVKEEAYMNYLDKEGIAMFDDAKRLIQRLCNAGIKMAVASSSKNAKYVLEQTGMVSVFDVIVTGNDVTKNKPDPEIFLLAARRMNIPKESLVIIEDSPAGIHAGIRSKIPVIALNRSSEAMELTEEMKSAHNLQVVQSLDGI